MELSDTSCIPGFFFFAGHADGFNFYAKGVNVSTDCYDMPLTKPEICLTNVSWLLGSRKVATTIKSYLNDLTIVRDATTEGVGTEAGRETNDFVKERTRGLP